MSLKDTPALHSFLSTYFSEVEPEADGQAVQAFVGAASSTQRDQVLMEARRVVERGGLSVEELGIDTNRWFSSSEEACQWLGDLAGLLDAAGAENPARDAVTKDVNGAILNEGDSVQVIKDLKVRGGSSDLKRGTLVKKIHLIGDPENIECRVDGSTLVLKTCFLKKV